MSPAIRPLCCREPPTRVRPSRGAPAPRQDLSHLMRWPVHHGDRVVLRARGASVGPAYRSCTSRNHYEKSPATRCARSVSTAARPGKRGATRKIRLSPPWTGSASPGLRRNGCSSRVVWCMTVHIRPASSRSIPDNERADHRHDPRMRGGRIHVDGNRSFQRRGLRWVGEASGSALL